MTYLRICFWNANGLSQHRNEIQHFLYSQHIDILLVSETHFTWKNCFKIAGYCTYDTKHPSGRACGGSAILVHKDVKHFLMPEYEKEHIQATSINLPDNGTTISAVYCPPKYNIRKEQFIEYFKTLGPKFISAGDYNAKHTFWGSRLLTPRGRQLYDAISSCKMDAMSAGQPTYWPTDRNKIPDVIDIAVFKNIKRESVSLNSSLDLSSDHSPTILLLHDNPSSLKNSNLSYPNKNTNWHKYKMYISSHLPNNLPLKSNMEIEYAVNQISTIMTCAAKVSTPIASVKKNISITYPGSIESLVREKRRLRRLWQEYRSPNLKILLKECQTKLQHALKEEKESNLHHYLLNLGVTEKSDYSLWKAVKKIRRPTTYEAPIRLQNGKWARNSEEKVEAFANHLENVFTPNVTGSHISPPIIDDKVQHPFNFRLATLRTAIKRLNAKKAPGYDKITALMIKNLPTSAIRVILFIFNSILRVGSFPASWKISEIIMIPKPGKDITQVTSYRPISLLPILSKLFERMFLNRLLQEVDLNTIIPYHQFGFRKNHSTTEQIHRITNLIRDAFEKKQYCTALFIDISQAFDKVWHDGLIYKILNLLPANVHKLFRSYLENRYFHTKSKSNLSSRKRISAGVPQGSILGPFLYLLFTADMPTSSLVNTSTFADDTAFISTHENPVLASAQLQSHIKELEKWLDKWKIKVNASKCVHITFTLKRKNCPPLSINGLRIPEQNHTKYLGLHLDRRLTWTHHIAAKITQIKLKSAQLHWLIGPRSTLDLSLKVLLYKAVIKPIWAYGIQLWGTASSSNIEKLQRRQSKLLRMITCAPWYIKNNNIHRDLNIPTIREEIKKATTSYLIKLLSHPNHLARNLLLFEGHSRLKRLQTMDLT